MISTHGMGGVILEIVKEKLKNIKNFLLKNRYLKRMIEFAFAFMFATAGGHMFSNEYAPFGTAALAAAWMVCADPYFALAGAMLGALAFSHYASLATSALYMGMGILYKLWKRRVRSMDKLLLLALAQAIMLPMFYMQSIDTCLVGIASMFIGAVSAAVLGRGAYALENFIKGRRLRNTDQISLLLFSAILVISLSSVQLYINLGVLLAAFSALCAVRSRGVSGVAAAVLLSIACLIYGGSDFRFVGVMSFCALIASLFLYAGRWGVVAGFMGTWAISAYLFSLSVASYISASIGAMAFLLLPDKIMRRMASYSSQREKFAAEQTLENMKLKLKSSASVVREVSMIFAQNTGAENDFMYRQLNSVSSLMERISDDERNVNKCNFNITMGAAGCPKEDSDESGDSVGARRIGSELVLLISDGMGSGIEAKKESSAAIEMFGDMLEAGFEFEEVKDCVNKLLGVRKGEEDMYATLDVVIIDLFDATSRFVKFGAPPSYILRGGKVHTLYAESPPVGILPEVLPCITEVSLKKGDAIIMMTDGTLDALGDELMRAIIEKIGGANTPSDGANELLLYARERSGEDDMSVLVARVS